MSNALINFSNIDVFLGMKYDSNAALERHNNIFPDSYVSYISARIPAISRGVGSYERIRAGKTGGAKHEFVPIKRQLSIDLRFRRCNMQISLKELGESLMDDANEVNESGFQDTNVPMMLSPMNLAMTTVPYLNSQYNRHIVNWDQQIQTLNNTTNNTNVSVMTSRYSEVDRHSRVYDNIRQEAASMGMSLNVLGKLKSIRKCMNIEDQNNYTHMIQQDIETVRNNTQGGNQDVQPGLMEEDIEDFD